MASSSSKIMISPERPKIICLGADDGCFEESEFKNRGLYLEYKDKVEVGDLVVSRGIILYFNKDKPGRFKAHIGELGMDPENHDIKVQAYCSSEADYLAMKAIIDSFDCRIDPGKINMPLHAVAEQFRRHEPMPAPNYDLDIKSHSELSNTQDLLLRTAFHDCSKIIVKTLSGGLSAISFSIHALFRDSAAGPRPLPFFAKIDAREKIRNEITNYQSYVHYYIPFNLRPNLQEDRCFMGAQEGIIVGNMAEYTESLLSSSRRGVARSAINSLFDDSLRGWRIQAEIVTKNPASELNQQSKLVFNPERCNNTIYNIAKTNGAKKSPSEILHDIYAISEISYYETPIHGDLHGKNVLVRNFDAILIDFERTRRGPHLSDIASLEVSLVFDTAKEDKKLEWERLVNSLYSEEFLKRTPGPAKEPSDREWIWECVRILRQRAFSEQLSWKEYPLMLAMYMLRRSHWEFEENIDNDLKGLDTYKRAYAYVIAEKLVDLVNGSCG